MLCDDLEGGMGRRGRQVQEGGGIYIYLELIYFLYSRNQHIVKQYSSKYINTYIPINTQSIGLHKARHD